MAGKKGFTGKETLWIHNTPLDAPDRDEAPDDPSEPAPSAEEPSVPVAPDPTPAAPVGPPPIPQAPPEPERTGIGSTGVLIALLVLGGLALGFVVLLAIGVVGAVSLL